MQLQSKRGEIVQRTTIAISDYVGKSKRVDLNSDDRAHVIRFKYDLLPVPSQHRKVCKMPTPGSIWKHTCSRNTPTLVGSFFEKVTGKIMPLASLSEDADLVVYVRDASIGIEVKACGSRPCRVEENQLERYTELAQGFPFNAVLYVVFLYNNQRCVKEGAKRGTKLS